MRIVLLILAMGAVILAGGARAEETVPIGEVVADPDTFHFRMVSLQGTVREVTQLPPYTTLPDTACYGAYTFMLVDETGSVKVSVLGICGRPLIRTPEVTEGETILLVAQVFSPNHMTSSSPGEVPRLRVVANQITHLAPADPPADASVRDQPEETAKPEGDAKAKPEKDDAY